MKDADRDRLKTEIARRLAELEAAEVLGRDAQAVVTLDQQSVGRLSRMDALQGQAMARAQASRRLAEAARLRQALTRLTHDPDYGFCEACGDPLPLGRLLIDPAALCCVGCR